MNISRETALLGAVTILGIMSMPGAEGYTVARVEVNFDSTATLTFGEEIQYEDVQSIKESLIVDISSEVDWSYQIEFTQSDQMEIYMDFSAPLLVGL